MAKIPNWDRHTLDELVAMENQAREAGNMRRVEVIRWEIYYRTKEMRLARGEGLNEAGYTGRNSNRR